VVVVVVVVVYGMARVCLLALSSAVMLVCTEGRGEVGALNSHPPLPLRIHFQKKESAIFSGLKEGLFSLFGVGGGVFHPHSSPPPLFFFLCINILLCVSLPPPPQPAMKRMMQPDDGCVFGPTERPETRSKRRHPKYPPRYQIKKTHDGRFSVDPPSSSRWREVSVSLSSLPPSRPPLPKSLTLVTPPQPRQQRIESLACDSFSSPRWVPAPATPPLPQFIACDREAKIARAMRMETAQHQARAAVMRAWFDSGPSVAV
jgi:hypothetical protein